MEEDLHEQSEQPFDQVKFCNVIAGILILIIVSFFRENKSYGIKTICIDPLSIRC
jgi:hypothetical protein